MGQLKVAVVTPWKRKCGIFTYTEALCQALVEQDVEIYIIRLPRFGRKTVDILRKVVRKIPIDKVDLIHCEHEYGLFNKLDVPFFEELGRLGLPLVTTMHATGMRRTDDYIAELSDRVIVHNRYCLKRFRHKQDSVVISHGCDPQPVPPARQCKSELGNQPDAPIVGYLGFITETKGLETLIDAMAQVGNAGLLIGGGWHTGEETKYIRALKSKTRELLPGRCQWLGFVPDDRLATVYGAMDCLCYTSPWITESGALLMGLSHGRATLAADVPPNREKEEQGALMTFEDVDDLADKVRLLLEDDELRGGLEEAAMGYATSNSWDAVAQEHIELYRGLVG